MPPAKWSVVTALVAAKELVSLRDTVRGTHRIEPLRVACRRDAVDAAEALAAHHSEHGELELALSLLERAVGFDPYNETLYREIMNRQHQLGRPDAAKRTLRLLTSRLADIDVTPEPDTLRMAAAPHPPPTATTTPPPRRAQPHQPAPADDVGEPERARSALPNHRDAASADRVADSGPTAPRRGSHSPV